jgi:hypothetical protein
MFKGCFDAGRFVDRNAVDLRGVKDGVVLQDMNQLPTVLGIFVFNLLGLGEKDGRGLLALSELPLFALRLLVGHPARVAALAGAEIRSTDPASASSKSCLGTNPG